VVNMGVGDSQTDPRLMEAAVKELGQITGQKASIRKARRSISGFKLREGANIGCMVTLRGERMYEFLDRLLSVAIPRIRDFRGLSPTSFDKFGNYTMAVREQLIFPEINLDDVTRVRGMNITLVIRNSKSSEESRELLRKFGMPFRN
jgi:large subunit ribosomal protein L5